MKIRFLNTIRWVFVSVYVAACKAQLLREGHILEVLDNVIVS
jgi:hypothetical protein